jgi:hypothetical protein
MRKKKSAFLFLITHYGALKDRSRITFFVSVIGIWKLEFVWNLVLGAWNLSSYASAVTRHSSLVTRHSSLFSITCEIKSMSSGSAAAKHTRSTSAGTRP